MDQGLRRGRLSTCTVKTGTPPLRASLSVTAGGCGKGVGSTCAGSGWVGGPTTQMRAGHRVLPLPTRGEAADASDRRSAPRTSRSSWRLPNARRSGRPGVVKANSRQGQWRPIADPRGHGIPSGPTTAGAGAYTGGAGTRARERLGPQTTAGAAGVCPRFAASACAIVANRRPARSRGTGRGAGGSGDIP